MKIKIMLLGIVIINIFILVNFYYITDSSKSYKQQVQNGQLVISEVVLNNQSIITDEDWEFSDYIEIYNKSNEMINLDGFGLSDNFQVPHKWQFPDVSIPGKGYLIVFASGKDKSESELHTNFKLDDLGETITLSDSSGNILERLTVSGGISNVSYSLKSNDEYAFFTTGTPRRPNQGIEIKDVEAYQQQLLINATVDSGFYTAAFDVKLVVENKDVQLFYTLDGSEPTENSIKYTEAIKIDNRELDANLYANISPTFLPYTKPLDMNVFKGTILKVRAFLNHQPVGEMLAKSYFVTPLGSNRYSLPVVSIVADPEDLFSEEKGIYVPGSKYRLLAGNDITGETPANYNQKSIAWERPIHLTYFDENGKLLLEQELGIRTFGGYSRANAKKSFKLFARDEYDTKNDAIDFNFFDNEIDVNGDPLDNYKTILLRAGGNDWNVSLIRDVFLQAISPENIDKQAAKPCILFINGEYWGIYYLQEMLDENYLFNHYQIDSNESAILESGNNSIKLYHGEEDELVRFNKIQDEILNVNMDRSDSYQFVNQYFDIDNLIDYYSSEIFFVNTDWPANNMKIWRKTVDITDKNIGTVLDGRYRYMLYDLDFGFGLFDIYSSVDHNTIEFVTDENNSGWPNPAWSTALLRKLLENKQFEQQFILYMADLLNTKFESENVLAELKYQTEQVELEMNEYINRWEMYELPDVQSWKNVQIKKLEKFAQERPDYVRNQYLNYFKLSSTWVLKLEGLDSTRGRIQINKHVMISDNKNIFSGIYFENCNVELEAIPSEGYEFIGWENLQGNIIKENSEIVITENTNYTLRPVFVKEE